MKQSNKIFRSHLFIEYYFRQEQKFLLEHFHSDNKKLFESYGLFENIEEVVDKIYYDVLLKNKTELIIDNNWIHNIEILYINDDNLILKAGYNFRDSKLKNNKFNPLGLIVNNACIDDKNIKSILAHELQHAYEDYNRRVNNKLSLYDVVYNFQFPKNKPGTYKGNKNKLSYILYFIRKVEQNGYISQLNKELKQNRNKFVYIDDIYNFIKTTDTYDNYSCCIKWIDDIINVKNKQEQENILQYCEELSVYKFNTFNQLTKFLITNKNKILKKFYNIVPKIIYNNINLGSYID